LIALANDPHYVKALQRRAAANEAIGSWSALTSAQEGTTDTKKPSPTLTTFTDYRTLLSLLPESPTQRSEINRALKNLEPRIENKRKEETGEMMGQLKELGNKFLGSPHDQILRDEM